MNRQEKVPKTQNRELIALHLVSNLGAHRIRQLLEATDHPQDIFRMNRRELQAIDGIGPATAAGILSFDEWAEVDRILQKTADMGAALMAFGDEDYPSLLREIYDPPLLLWIKGNRRALDTDSVAVVGTRRAGSYGKDAAKYFTKGLSQLGLTIVSGLAYGIDAAAHRAAVEADGRTVAVLGSGIDNIYPAAHKKLAADIIDSGGAVISEFPLGTAPDAGNFPVRNRVVSGLSLGTLVAASGIAGGSMITAKLALDQNREVFVVPHPIGTPNAIGCNNLIQRGMGKLVQDVGDILAEIEVHVSNGDEMDTLPDEPRWRSLELDELSTAVCRALQQKALHVDRLAEQVGVKSHKLLPKLLELEIQQCVRQTSGKNFELI